MVSGDLALCWPFLSDLKTCYWDLTITEHSVNIGSELLSQNILGELS